MLVFQTNKNTLYLVAVTLSLHQCKNNETHSLPCTISCTEIYINPYNSYGGHCQVSEIHIFLDLPEGY